MGAERLPMRQIREILRLKHEQGLRHRAIARACGVDVGTVSEYLGRAQRAGLGWPLPPEQRSVSPEPGSPAGKASISLACNAIRGRAPAKSAFSEPTPRRKPFAKRVESIRKRQGEGGA